jgi:hypothetical protein
MHKLINKAGEKIEPGFRVTSFRDEVFVLRSFQPPRSPNSTGRVYVSAILPNGAYDKAERELYPSVFNLEIVEDEVQA